MSNTMELWDKVSKTNPKYTKKVKLGREFTAIDPHSQIMEATRAFGPAGDKWGWKVVQVEMLETHEVAILVELWHGNEGNAIQQWGQAGLYIDKNNTRKDTDCMKKATTDGLTKCLSYLGFNADVFLGLFDDNKYVAQMKKEHEEKPVDPLGEGDRAFVNQVLKELEDASTLAEVEHVLAQHKTALSAIKKASVADGRAIFTAYNQAKSRFPEAA